MKVACLSDIHGYINQFSEIFPGIDLVILPGDFCSLDRQDEQEKEFPGITEKLREMFPDAQEFIVVPGNHDYLLDSLSKSWNPDLAFRKLLGADFKVLIDERYIFLNLLTGESLEIYGAPRTDLWMAFPRLHGSVDIKRIPLGIDILVTHEAPRWYSLDCVKEYVGRYGTSEPGNELLYERVRIVKPKYHIFGHIHRNCIKDSGETVFINCSQMNGSEFLPQVRVFEIMPPGRHQNLINE